MQNAKCKIKWGDNRPVFLLTYQETHCNLILFAKMLISLGFMFTAK